MSNLNGKHGGGPAVDATLRHWTATECMPVALSFLQMAAAMGNRIEISPTVVAKNALILADTLIELQSVILPPDANKPKV